MEKYQKFMKNFLINEINRRKIDEMASGFFFWNTMASGLGRERIEGWKDEKGTIVY